jgi:hypothetical protein
MPPIRPPQARTGLLLFLALLAVGCAAVSVSKVGKAPDLLDAWKASVLADDQLSPRTRQTLRRCDLDEAYSDHPAEATAQLHALALKDPQPELLFALAEMNYLQGRQSEKWACDEAVGRYYLSAGYAYFYLFACAGQTPDATAPGSAATLAPSIRVSASLATYTTPAWPSASARPSASADSTPARNCAYRPPRAAPLRFPSSIPASCGSRRSSGRCCPAPITKSKVCRTRTTLMVLVCR